MENLSVLTLFASVAEHSSLAAGGRMHGLSASAAAKAITRLEERLAVRLFHRSTRTLSITAEGKLFLERVHRILSEYEAATLELAAHKRSPQGQLKVSLPMVSMLTVPAISSFMRRYPDITLDIDFSDRLVDVIEEGFDAVIRAGEPKDTRLMSRQVGVFRFQIVAAPAYLAEHGTPQSPKALISHACLHHRFASSGRLEYWPIKAFDSRDLPRSLIVNTIEPLIDLCVAGHGIACLPDFAIREELRARKLVALLARDIDHSGPFRVIWPSSRHMAPKVRVFIDHMAEHLFPAQD